MLPRPPPRAPEPARPHAPRPSSYRRRRLLALTARAAGDERPGQDRARTAPVARPPSAAVAARADRPQRVRPTRVAQAGPPGTAVSARRLQRALGQLGVARVGDLLQRRARAVASPTTGGVPAAARQDRQRPRHRPAPFAHGHDDTHQRAHHRVAEGVGDHRARRWSRPPRGSSPAPAACAPSWRPRAACRTPRSPAARAATGWPRASRPTSRAVGGRRCHAGAAGPASRAGRTEPVAVAAPDRREAGVEALRGRRRAAHHEVRGQDAAQPAERGLLRRAVRTCRAARPTPAGSTSACATAPLACTPASVRPATVRRTGLRARRIRVSPLRQLGLDGAPSRAGRPTPRSPCRRTRSPAGREGARHPLQG